MLRPIDRSYKRLLLYFQLCLSVIVFIYIPNGSMKPNSVEKFLLKITIYISEIIFHQDIHVEHQM